MVQISTSCAHPRTWPGEGAQRRLLAGPSWSVISRLCPQRRLGQRQNIDAAVGLEVGSAEL